MKLSDVYSGDLVLIQETESHGKDIHLSLNRIEQRQLFIYLRDKFNREQRNYLLKLMDDEKS
jgi:hypothetical protein